MIMIADIVRGIRMAAASVPITNLKTVFRNAAVMDCTVRRTKTPEITVATTWSMLISSPFSLYSCTLLYYKMHSTIMTQ
jgi:hypothetical protein